MSWKEITITTASEAEETVANVLNEAGANGVVVEDIRDVHKEKENLFGEIMEIDTSRFPSEGINIKAYFYINEDWPLKKTHIQETIENLSEYGIPLGKWSWTEKTVEEEDWANEWKKYFSIQQVTDTMTIVPSWKSHEVTDDKAILIDPGMAFGTGTHATTILSLQALEKYIKKDDIVLDVGVGSGVLSIAACKLGAKHVYSYDLDEVAIHSAEMNRDLNGLEDKITIQQHDLLNNIHNPGNIIVANILADILIYLVEDAWNNLYSGGYFITSGIIEEKEQLIKEKLQEASFEIIATTNLDNWITIVARKRT